MGINFNYAKKFAANQVLERVMDYVEKEPEKNFTKILNLLEKIAVNDNQKEEIRLLKEKVETNLSSKKFIKKLANASPAYRKGLIMNMFINATILGLPKRKEAGKELEGVKVPWTILIDPTSGCNLSCTGCWAGEYKESESFEYETLDRIINEAKNLGIHFIVFSGGEPTTYPGLLDICEKHDDVGFMMYTNGTLIDEEMAEKLGEIGNLTPAISIEGFKEKTDQRRGKGVFDKILNVMENLRKNGVIFGASLTITRNNADEMFKNDEFFDFLVDQGVTYVWSFHYVPVGKDPNLDLMLTPDQRGMVAERVPEIRNNKPLFMIDFWNDGILAEGCIAGGRRYFHINSSGDVEPCAFAHFAVDNIQENSLKEVLQNPLFQAYQKEQPFTENLMAPCPIIDNPDKLREMVDKAKAKGTHSEADNVLKGDIAESLDQISDNWHQKSQNNNFKRSNKGKLSQLF